MIDQELAQPVLQREADRREAPRLRTVYRAVRVRARGDEGLARIHNLSDDGMMLTAGFPVLLGDTIRVDLTDTMTVDGAVIWTNAPKVGLKLRNPIDSARVLRRICEEQRTGTARPIRLPIGRSVVAASQCGLKPVQLIDVSQKGMKIAHDGSFTPGLSVKIAMGMGVERRGLVRWSQDGFAGVILTEPFSIDELGSLKALRNPHESFAMRQ